jgi:carboxypeptidase Taq
MNESLKALLQFQATTWNFKGISALLGWDAKTYMPSAGVNARGQHLALIEGLVHERTTSEEYKRLLGRIVDLQTGDILDASLNATERRLVSESHRDYKLASALPNEFVRELSETAVQSEYFWEQARAKDDYALYAPHLAKIIDLVKRKADYLSLGKTPYDALLNLYEPGATTDWINGLFADLRDQTINLVGKLPPPAPEPAWLVADYDHARQMELARELISKMGMPSDRVRLDLTAHPFCTTIHPNDIRVTTRFERLPDFILTILHETGHALYEAGLPQEWYGSPLCEAASMGLHESQSRFWEIGIGKSRAFWEGLYPRLQNTFPAMQTIPLDAFYAAATPMGPSFIRVGADELTYNLHIIVRFELEQQMINGSVNVNELPKLWNDKYEQYLGIRPKNNREGILQDVHWAFGDLGYFPTYTLGNIYAATWFQQIRSEMPDFDARVRALDFAPILNWLVKKIHKFGRAKTGAELVQSIAGHELTARPLIEFLRERAQSKIG